MLNKHLCSSVWFVASSLVLSIASGVSLIPLAAAESRAEELRAALLDGFGATRLIVAHRADWRNYPENSLPAIESCIAMGLEMVEIDLRRTQDGQLVLMHDATLDRTTTGTGKVADLTLAGIHALRLRNGYGAVTPFGVPTLREALLIARGRILLNLDKSYDYFRVAVAVIEETGTTREVVMKGPHPVAEVLARHGDLLAKVAYMPVINFTNPNALQITRDWLETGRPCAIEFVFLKWEPAVTEAFDLCRQRGVRIWVNVLWPELAGGMTDDLALSDPDGVYGVLLDRGVSIFQTDRPRELRGYLTSRAARSP